MDKDEKIELLRHSQDLMFEIIENLETVFGDDKYVKAYMIDHLKIRASSDHGFLSNDLNFDKLCERLEK